MNNCIARFEKVDFEVFKSSFSRHFSDLIKLTDESIKAIYNSIKLPERPSSDSATYEFTFYLGLNLRPGVTITIPTGIRADVADGWCLMILPKDDHGFNYKIQLDNTISIIDSNYSSKSNGGQIIIKLTNNSSAQQTDKTLRIRPGDRYLHGVFVPYGITIDDKYNEEN